MFAWILDVIFPIRTDEEIVRELTVETFLSHLAPTLEERTRPATVTLLPFGDRRVRAAIHEAKYHGNDRAFELLAAALGEYLRQDDRFDGCNNTVLVPVPLGKKRRRERGFNQVEEVLKRICKELSIPLAANLLVRTRETITQVSLPKTARAKNMRGAFVALKPADPNRTYLLVDDVTTTGATLGAAITALKEAGATDILPIALAH